jgi:hypothetical protein
MNFLLMKSAKHYQRLFLSIIVTLSSVFTSSAQGDWILYKADAVLSFEVQVPAEMGVKTKEITTDLGTMTTTTYAHEAGEEASNFLYVINVVEYPPGVFPADSIDLIDDFLSEAILSIADGLDGELVYQSDIQEENNGQGMLFRLKYKDGFGVIKGKTYMKDDVFITLQVYTTKDNSLNDEMDLFLDSFRAMF